MKKLTSSFPLRLSLWICAVTLLLGAVITLVIGYVVQDKLRDNLQLQAMQVVSDSSIKIDSVFLQAEQVANVMDVSLEQLDLTAENVEKYVNDVIKRVDSASNEITGIAVAFEENVVAGHSYFFALAFKDDASKYHTTIIRDNSLDYHARDWYMLPKTLDKPIWNTPFYSEGGMNGYLLAYSTPIHRNGEIIGVVVVDIMVEDLTKFIASQSLGSIKQLSPDSEIFLMNQFGRVMVYPDRPELNDLSLYGMSYMSDIPLESDRQAIKSIYTEKRGDVKLDSIPDLMSKAELFYSTSVNDWVVGVIVPQDWKNPVLFTFAIQLLFIVLAVLVVIVVVVFIVSKTVSKPLESLSNVTKIIGSGDFTAKLPEIKYMDEVGELTNSFHNMQLALMDYISLLEQNLISRERVEGELNAAKAIQMDILPRILPPVPTSTRLVCNANIIQTRGVGGDLYDVLHITDDMWAVIIGDVSGKGVPASLMMAITATMQRSIIKDVTTPSELVTQLNGLLSEGNSTNMFVTYWCGIINEKTGTLTYTNAGHNPPLIKHHDGRVSVLSKRHGPMLGVVMGKEYGQDNTTLANGDMLIMYTDGVVEAHNENDELYGDKKFQELVASKGNIGPRRMIMAIEEAIVAHTNGFDQSDDIAILITQYGDDTAMEKMMKVPAAPEQLDALLQLFDEFSASKLLNKRAQNVVRVAIEEMFANVVNHGYEGKSGEVTVRIWLEDRVQLRISFSDNSAPFNPLDYPDVKPDALKTELKAGGLGIHMVRKKMDYMAYEYKQGYNVLTIGKNIGIE